MSKYQELKQAVSDAEAVIERLLFEGPDPDAYEAALEQREAAEKALAAFESGAAALIERGVAKLKRHNIQCAEDSGVHSCEICAVSATCDVVDFVKEMEAL